MSALKPDSQQLAIKDETPGYQLSEKAKNEVEKFKVKKKLWIEKIHFMKEKI